MAVASLVSVSCSFRIIPSVIFSAGCSRVRARLVRAKKLVSLNLRKNMGAVVLQGQIPWPILSFSGRVSHVYSALPYVEMLSRTSLPPSGSPARRAGSGMVRRTIMGGLQSPVSRVR